MKGKHCKQPSGQVATHKDKDQKVSQKACQSSVPAYGNTEGYQRDIVSSISGQSNQTQFEIKGSHSQKVRHFLRNAMVILLAVIALTYAAGAFYFHGHFCPNTTMGSLDISNKSVAEVTTMIEEYSQDYSVRISGLGFGLEVTSQDVTFDIDAHEIASSAAGSVNSYLWPLMLVKDSHDMSSHLKVKVDEDELFAFIDSHVAVFNQGASAPTDAHPVYDADKDFFVIEGEKRGTMLDSQAITDKTLETLDVMGETVELDAHELQQAKVLSDDERLGPAVEAANEYLTCDFTLMLGEYEAACVNADIVSQWVVFDEDLNPYIDESAVKSWTDEFCDTYDSIDHDRTYTRPDGKEVTVNAGTYGWQIDENSILPAVMEAVENQTVGSFAVPCTHEGNGTNPELGYDWGAFCDVDLTEQHARYYDASGELLWESDVVTGTGNTNDATPTGVYKVNAKETNITLKGPMVPDPDNPEKKKPKWSSPVSYWIPFIANSHGLHDATWQSAFGGERYLQGFGSHGCVNLPLDKAKELYDIIQVGDPVIVHW